MEIIIIMKTTEIQTKAEVYSVITNAISEDNVEPVLNSTGLTNEQLNHQITETEYTSVSPNREAANEVVGKTPRSLINDAFGALKRGGELTVTGAGKFALAVVGVASFVVGQQIFNLGKIAKFATFGLANTIPVISFKPHKNDIDNQILPKGFLHNETRNGSVFYNTGHIPGSVNDLQFLNQRVIKASITHDQGRVNLLERIGFQLARTGIAAMNQTQKTWIPSSKKQANQSRYK